MFKTESIKIVKESELSFFTLRFPPQPFFFYSLLHNFIIFPSPPPHSIVFYPSPTRLIFFLHETLFQNELKMAVSSLLESRGERKMKRVGEG